MSTALSLINMYIIRGSVREKCHLLYYLIYGSRDGMVIEVETSRQKYIFFSLLQFAVEQQSNKIVSVMKAQKSCFVLRCHYAPL